MSKARQAAEHSARYIATATGYGLMHAAMEARPERGVVVRGREVVDYANCSYLGLDRDPEMIAAAQRSLATWGLHYCCARSRLSTGELWDLEAELSAHFGAPSVTFPSVTSAHLSAMPLLASGLLLDDGGPEDGRPVHFVFDRFAHASMQSLRALLNVAATTVVIGHNDMAALRRELAAAKAAGKRCVYACDGVYSMGGASPIDEILALCADEGLFAYVDDAHGTSIFGEHGEGFVASRLAGAPWPKRLFVPFSLAKGFGCNGGGLTVPTPAHEDVLRRFGQTYAFSGPLDFAMVGAARRGLEYHRNGRVADLQKVLRARVALFDARRNPGESLPFSPIRMVAIGDEDKAIEAGRLLLEKGHYVSTVFYPVVPRGEAQLRVCLTARHSEADIERLCRAIDVATGVGTAKRREDGRDDGARLDR